MPQPGAFPRKPLVSVVIPCEPGTQNCAALAALRALPRKEQACLEVLVAQGRNPGRQRNLAAQKAKGRWLWFLDKDSAPEPGCLGILLREAQSRDLAVVGGPNLPLKDEGAAGLRCDHVLRSWFGSMASRARYRSVGLARPCTEKQLIGCNLFVRADAFRDAGAFREDLYPNEENELLERLSAEGQALWYEPLAIVRRGRRLSAASFGAQAFAYGRGRARQARLAWTWGSLGNGLPLFLLLLWAACLFGALDRGPAGAPAWTFCLPLAYGCTCMAAAHLDLRTARLFVLRHHAYALGLCAGLSAPLPSFPKEVRVSRIALGGLKAGSSR